MQGSLMLQILFLYGCWLPFFSLLKWKLARVSGSGAAIGSLESEAWNSISLEQGLVKELLQPAALMGKAMFHSSSLPTNKKSQVLEVLSNRTWARSWPTGPQITEDWSIVCNIFCPTAFVHCHWTALIPQAQKEQVENIIELYVTTAERNFHQELPSLSSPCWGACFLPPK